MIPIDILDYDFDQKTLYYIYIKRLNLVVIHHVDVGDTLDHQYYINHFFSLPERFLIFTIESTSSVLMS